MFGQILVVLLFALEVTAIYFVWRAVSQARTAQGAAAWVMFLIWAPYAAVPLFLILGHHRYRGYVITRRESKRVVRAVQDLGDAWRPARASELDPMPLERIAGLPAIRGNSVCPLIDGEAAFASIFAAIDTAQHYVLVQFYIVRDDDLGRAFRNRLIAAARRGVHVRFLMDAIGSYALSADYIAQLEAVGVEVAIADQRLGVARRLQLNFRNHRKTVIVDGQVGFTGGLNVGDEYMGRDPAYGRWRDTHVEMKGPVVSQLQLIFVEDWHWAVGGDLPEDLIWETPAAEADQTAMVVATGPGDTMETGALFFFSAIAGARHRVWIASPYCVPDRDVLTALKHAALRGVDVRLLLPDVIDHYLVWTAAFAFFDELRDVGVQIWRYTDGFLHQKVVLVDDDFAAVGTSNLDNRSFRLNFEAMVAVFAPEFAHKINAMLTEDFANAYLLERALADQPLRLRVGAPLARLFAPVL